MSEKIKTWKVECGGEVMIATKPEEVMQIIEALCGSLTNLEPDPGEEEGEDIVVTVQRKYTQEEVDNLPEWQ